MRHFTFFIVVVLFATSANVNAQYKQNKLTYNYKQYTPEIGDPYNPGVTGIASFFIPGLGQMLSDEGGRGAGFLAGYAGCWLVYGIGAGAMANDVAYDGYYDGAGSGLVLLGALGAVSINIWSIVDAVRVAKVNNMAVRDRNSSSSLQINPGIKISPQGKAIPSMSMSFTF